MKNIRITLAALLAIGAASVAGAQQTRPTTPNARGHIGAHAKGPGRHGLRAMRGALLRGITLNDVEKANLKRVQENSAKQVKALRDQYKPQHQALREARQRHDTAAVKALREKGAAEREAMKNLLNTQRADVRAALTLEHQTKFDANVAAAQKRLANRPKRVGKNG